MFTASMIAAALSLTGCQPTVATYDPPIAWRQSVAIGQPWRGRLKRGVHLPTQGPNHVTYNPARQVTPNRWDRRWGTDRLIRTTLCVIDDFRAAHPDAPRVVIGDLSRPQGGPFGRRFGGLGHSSHQNGLDVDIYYPRWDQQETAPSLPEGIDVERAQELVDRFVAAGATAIYIGVDIGLERTANPKVVKYLRHHEDHMHVRISRQPVAPLRVR